MMDAKSQRNDSAKDVPRVPPYTPKPPPLQANILHALPPELLVAILTHLATKPPSDIATCRLVNRTFCELSSPFLLPRVVFARRLNALTKFREVLQHPYFRLHVTELVYDGSTYVEATATDWNQYVEDCERAPRDLEDAAWVERQRRDGLAWKELASFRNQRRVLVARSASDLSMALTDGGTCKEASGSSSPTTSASDEFRLGCNNTFADYAQRYADQEEIRRSGVDRNILTAAFASFPNLRSIVETDYRSLAHKGESYDACCRRQFGKALEPQHAGVGAHTGVAGDGLFFVLDVLADSAKGRISELAIGPHPFEYTGEDTSELADPHHPQNPRYLDISALKDVALDPDTKLARTLKGLEYLRLALCYSGQSSDEGHMREQVRKLLKASAPRLQSLTVHMIYLFWGGVREVPKVDNHTRFDVFGDIMGPLHMPYLRSLSLRRWIFTAEELKAFLLVHAGTLRNLHLLGCLCGDSEADLARWGGQNMLLTGIELSGFLSVVDTRSANPHGWDSCPPGLWSQTRSMAKGRDVEALESWWLAGRRNGVKRQQRAEILPEGEWWKRPI